MEMSRELEPEIKLRDCLFHVLYRWRSILAAALIGALVLGGYTWWQNRNRKSEKTETPAVQTQEAVDESGRNLEISNEIYNGLLDSNAQYKGESLVLQMNAARVWKATAVYSVITEEEPTEGWRTDPGIAMAQNYAAAAPSLADRKAAEAVYGEAGAREAETLMICSAIGGASNGFRLTALGTTREMAEGGLRCLMDGVEAFSRGSAQEMGSHRLVLLSQEAAEVADSELESRQAAIAKNISTYQSAITSNNKALTTTTTTKSTASSGTSKTPKKSLVKYAVLGGVAGLGAVAVFWLLVYILSGTIKGSEILTKQYGMPIYGMLRHSRARTPGKGLDGLIEKWEFHGQAAENETVYDNIAALIPEEIEGKILLTGTIGEEKLKPLFEALRKRMSGKAELRMEGKLIHNSRAVSEAKKAEAVLMVEERYESREKDIQRACEMLALSETPVLGAVMI